MNSRLVNSTFLHNKEGCPLDVTGTGEGAYMVYFVSFLGTLAVLPGNIVSALLMDKIGRLRMLGKGVKGRVRLGQAVRELLTSSCGRDGPECFPLSSPMFCLGVLQNGGGGPGIEVTLGG